MAKIKCQVQGLQSKHHMKGQAMCDHGRRPNVLFKSCSICFQLFVHTNSIQRTLLQRNRLEQYIDNRKLAAVQIV